jgi:hypothetical protein
MKDANAEDAQKGGGKEQWKMKGTRKTVSVRTWIGREEIQGERMEGRMSMEKKKEKVKENDEDKGGGERWNTDGREKETRVRGEDEESEGGEQALRKEW